MEDVLLIHIFWTNCQFLWNCTQIQTHSSCFVILVDAKLHWGLHLDCVHQMSREEGTRCQRISRETELPDCSGMAQRQEKTALRLKVVFKANLHRSLESQVQELVQDDTSKTETFELACSACTSVTQNTAYFPQVLLQSCSSSDLTKKDEVLIKNTKRQLRRHIHIPMSQLIIFHVSLIIIPHQIDLLSSFQFHND